jgi:hypothetical protein
LGRYHCGMEDLETSAALAFHGVAYVVTVAVERQELLLQVEVEDPAATAGGASAGGNAGSSAGDCWTARFPAACEWRLSVCGLSMRAGTKRRTSSGWLDGQTSKS